MQVWVLFLRCWCDPHLLVQKCTWDRLLAAVTMSSCHKSSGLDKTVMARELRRKQSCVKACLWIWVSEIIVVTCRKKKLWWRSSQWDHTMKPVHQLHAHGQCELTERVPSAFPSTVVSMGSALKRLWLQEVVPSVHNKGKTCCHPKWGCKTNCKVLYFFSIFGLLT